MSIIELTKTIKATIATLPPAAELKKDERIALFEACEKLKNAIQTPFEATQKILFAPHQVAAVQIAIDVGLFDILVGGAELSVAELAEKTKMQEALIVRWIRMLAGMGLLKELPGGKLKASDLGLAFTTNSPYANASIFLTKVHEVCAKLPEYLRKTGYKNPKDAFDGPLQFVNGNQDHYFTFIEKNPRVQSAFNQTMAIPRLSFGEEEWFEYFPVKEKLLRGITEDDILLADIGGGRGHDLVAFQKKYAGVPGRLVLQDLPVVINNLKGLPKGIELAAHDFFTPQPLKGARAYYMRTVLHDWPDKQAQNILKNLRDAMGKDSLLLIYELIVPDEDHTVWHAQMDITLMATLAALERTRQQWVDLLDAAGLKLQAVWEPKNGVSGSGSLLEVVLK